MRPFGTLVTGLAGLALWAMLLNLAGRNVDDQQNEAFEIENMPTEWAEPATAVDSTTATDGIAETPLSAAETTLNPSPPSVQEAEQPAGAADTGNADPRVPNRPGVRPVNPELFAAPFTEAAGPLERIEPRLPVVDKEPERVKVVLLPRPESVEAGLIAFGGRNLKLADITTTDRMRVCPTSKGGDWPCGMMARTQQRLFLRNRTIACEADNADWQGTIEAHCRIGELDIAKWLAENGWVEVPEGSPFTALVEKARSERLGIFGDDPR
jgi:hypothetical protein